MADNFKTMNIGNMPKLPEMPVFTLPDSLAPPTFDIAPPTLATANAEQNAEFDKSTEYYFKPAFTSLPDYSDEAQLRQKFRAMRRTGEKLDVAKLGRPECSYFIIRSNNIDDLHKVG